jgi:hypothetical protein
MHVHGNICDFEHIYFTDLWRVNQNCENVGNGFDAHTVSLLADLLLFHFSTIQFLIQKLQRTQITTPRKVNGHTHGHGNCWKGCQISWIYTTG